MAAAFVVRDIVLQVADAQWAISSSIKWFAGQDDFRPGSTRAVNASPWRLVDHGPESANLPDGVDEFPVAHRLTTVGVDASW